MLIRMTTKTPMTDAMMIAKKIQSVVMRFCALACSASMYCWNALSTGKSSIASAEP